MGRSGRRGLSGQITVENLVAQRYGTALTPGSYGNVQIVSYEPGKIVFKPLLGVIPTGGTWSGVLNIFKFKFSSNYSGPTQLSLEKK